MQDLDIDGIVKALSSPEVGENAGTIMDMLNEVNKVLGTVQKTMGLLEQMGLKPLVVRAAGQKLGVDAESPLKSEASSGLRPSTGYHATVFEQLNTLTEEQISQILVSGVSSVERENNDPSDD